MRRRITPFLWLAATWIVPGVTSAQDTGATGNGNWESPSTWTTGAVPGASNNVYIGSTYPAGAAATAAVTLTANGSASSVSVGLGNGTNGTLNLGGNALSIITALDLGVGGTATLQEGAGGSFTALSAYETIRERPFGPRKS